jgi:gliding motility-associated-like protein
VWQGIFLITHKDFAFSAFKLMINRFLLIIGILFCSQQIVAQIVPTNGERVSIYFDGADDFIDGSSNNRNISNQVTLETWVFTKSAASMGVGGKYDPVTGNGFYLYIRNGKAAFGNGVSGSGFSATSVNDNRWHHLAGVCNNGVWEIWVDGIRENSATGPAATLNSNATFTIGKISNAPPVYFNGYLGEIRLWNTARSISEIRSNMCREIKNPNQTLAAYYNFDFGTIQNPSNILADFSVFNLGGTYYHFNNNSKGLIQSAPPVGDESIYFYGAIPQNSIFKIVGPELDTLKIEILHGQPTGIQLYRVNRSSNNNIYGSAFFYSNYYGVLTFGDSTTTYHLTSPIDTFQCRINRYLTKRKNCFSIFRKKTTGNFNSIADRQEDAFERDRGEYYFAYKYPPTRNYFNGSKTFCQLNSNKTLEPSRGYTFRWNTGDTTRILKITTPGKYYVNAFDFCGAPSTDTFRVSMTPPVNFPQMAFTDTVLCEGREIQFKLPAGFTYKWQDGQTTNPYAIAKPGAYWVDITDPYCQTTIRRLFNVQGLNCTEGVFIPNIITPNHDGLNDYFVPVGLNPGQWHLSVYNRWGREVYQNPNYKNNWDAENVNGGIYFYHFQNPAVTKTFKGWLEVVK